MSAYVLSLGSFRELAIFLVTLVTGIVSISLLLRFWKWKRGSDAGDGIRKMQAKPVLRVGGIALYLVFVLAVVFAGQVKVGENSTLMGMPFLLLGTAMFLLGLFDDLFGSSPIVRLLIQVGVGVIAYQFGMRIDVISSPFGDGGFETGGFSLILTVIWFVSIPNLINLVDGMDGLAGGIAMFLCITLGTMGFLSGDVELLVLNVALVGGIIAFLGFNLPPAKIYMGDGGAYLLGFIIAGSSLLTSNKGSIFGSLLVVVIVLGFPILDTALAMIRRVLSGLPVMKGDALHLHHRLLTLGFSKRNILFVLYGIFAGLSLLALSVFVSAGYSLPIVGMVATIGMIQGLRYLGLPHNLTQARNGIRDLVAARKDIRYAYAMSQVLEHDLDRLREPRVYWDAFRNFMERLQLSPYLPEEGDMSGSGKERLVVIKLDSTTRWLLVAPQETGSNRHWERVARCFLPVIFEARTLWGRELPQDLGFIEFPSESELSQFELRLKQAPSGGIGEPATV
jgi:UDP-GlcNAc:undecaprenyl-phosphate/decaprenyl-phosphate GlcNAc-1-phosphate transferase